MKKFAALALGLSVAALTAAAPASAQGSAWGKDAAPGQSVPYQSAPGVRDDDDLAGGPRSDRGDPRFADRTAPQPQFRAGGWDRPDSVGRTSAFFIHPRLNGGPVSVDFFRGNGRRAAEDATDNFCRRVGYREGAYYSIDRTRRGAVLEDVLCIR